MVLKGAFGTDTECRTETRHKTEVLALHAERKIDSMNEATARLANLQPASNISEALRQINGG